MANLYNVLVKLQQLIVFAKKQEIACEHLEKIFLDIKVQ